MIQTQIVLSITLSIIRVHESLELDTILVYLDLFAL